MTSLNEALTTSRQVVRVYELRAVQPEWFISQIFAFESFLGSEAVKLSNIYQGKLVKIREKSDLKNLVLSYFALGGPNPHGGKRYLQCIPSVKEKMILSGQTSVKPRALSLTSHRHWSEWKKVWIPVSWNGNDQTSRHLNRARRSAFQPHVSNVFIVKLPHFSNI